MGVAGSPRPNPLRAIHRPIVQRTNWRGIKPNYLGLSMEFRRPFENLVGRPAARRSGTLRTGSVRRETDLPPRGRTWRRSSPATVEAEPRAAVLCSSRLDAKGCGIRGAGSPSAYRHAAALRDPRSRCFVRESSLCRPCRFIISYSVRGESPDLCAASLTRPRTLLSRRTKYAYSREPRTRRHMSFQGLARKSSDATANPEAVTESPAAGMPPPAHCSAKMPGRSAIRAVAVVTAGASSPYHDDLDA